MNALRRMTNARAVRFAPPPQAHRDNNNPLWKSTYSTTDGGPLTRTVTQEQQDKEDDERRKEAMRDLVESWMDRLQLISVITTFFASTEASMLTITTPSQPGGPMSIAAQIANVGFVGALVVHSNAAIISFLAAFFLIRYKLKVAKNEEKEADGKADTKTKNKASSDTNEKQSKHHHFEFCDSPTAVAPDNDPETGGIPSLNGLNPPHSEHETDPVPGRILVYAAPASPPRQPSITTNCSSTNVHVSSAAANRRTSTTSTQPIWSTNPHLVQVGPFESHPPTHLLSRCHSLCIFLSALGFLLGLMGILCYAWDRLPLSSSISASFFMTLCVVAAVGILWAPEPGEGTLSPRIYFLGEM